MELKKLADYTESELKGELETKFGELYDKWYAAGFCQTYGREDFVKNCMTIVDNEIEQLKKSESLPAVAESRNEITKYEKLASKG